MITDIRVPKLEMTQSGITVVKLLKKDGDVIEKGEISAVIETSKVTYEITTEAQDLVFYLKKVKEF